MTIWNVRDGIVKSGLRVGHQTFDERRGEVVMEVLDADGRNSVRLRFPYKSMDDPALVDVLVDLYFRELKVRQAKKMEKQKQ